MAYCTACGHLISDADRFCDSCGTPQGNRIGSLEQSFNRGKSSLSNPIPPNAPTQRGPESTLADFLPFPWWHDFIHDLPTKPDM
jgi:hypothetical protein